MPHAIRLHVQDEREGSMAISVIPARLEHVTHVPSCTHFPPEHVVQAGVPQSPLCSHCPFAHSELCEHVCRTSAQQS